MQALPGYAGIGCKTFRRRYLQKEEGFQSLGMLDAVSIASQILDTAISC